MFSEAISSISCRCRPSAPLTAAAISGSASARVAEKKESRAEAGLALEAVIGGISPRPQGLRRPAVGSVKAVGKDPCPYHTGDSRPRDRSRGCGSNQIFAPDMVDGRRNKPLSSGPAAGVPAFRHLPGLVGPEIGRLVDPSAVIARRTLLRLPDHAEPHGVAQLGMSHAGIPLRIDLLRAVLILDVGALIHHGLT